MVIPREKNIMTKITKEELIYLAGFMDGDSNILAQIIPRHDYLYKFQIRVSIIFYQKTSRNWFLKQWHDKLKLGTLRDRNDNMSELYIVGVIPVKTILLQLMPYLIIKKPTAKLILLIIDKLDQVKTRSDFIEVCKLVDKIAEYTESKKRIITAEYVSKYYSAGASNDIIN